MSVRLSDEFLKLLLGKKNLLAFSAGIDSSALFFLMLEQKIPFDVACVNYKMRANSDDEALHVKNLAKKFGKKSFILDFKLEKANFEKKARDVRYKFFDEIISKNGYENLLLAHQLDDRLEWFMMQMCKGAGISELSGFDKIEKRKTYKLIRPLWKNTKAELKQYLDEKNLPYFEDESNLDVKYKRNFFRKNFTSDILKDYKNGIINSFDYMQLDQKFLNGEFFYIEKSFFVYKLQNDLINIRLIDKATKRLGVLMSKSSRREALKKNVVINRKIALGRNEKYGFIAPFISDVTMKKSFKEKCRKAKIPPHIRAYMFREDIWFSG